MSMKSLNHFFTLTLLAFSITLNGSFYQHPTANFQRAIDSGASVDQLRKLFTPIDIDEQDEDGATALFRCCDKEQQEQVFFLLGRQANPDISAKTGETPLHVACKSRFSNLVSTLFIVGKANPNIQDSNGYTPLNKMMRWNVTKDIREIRTINSILLLLLQQPHIDIDRATNASDEFPGRSALMWACDHRYTIAVQRLLDAGADTFQVDAQGKNAAAIVTENLNKGENVAADLSLEDQLARQIEGIRRINPKTLGKALPEEILLGKSESTGEGLVALIDSYIPKESYKKATKTIVCASKCDCSNKPSIKAKKSTKTTTIAQKPKKVETNS